MEVIAIYPGRFHPFHKGHASSFNQLANEFGINNTYLALSQKQEMPKSPFSAGDRAKMAIALGIPKENIISVKQPYQAQEYIEKFKNAGIDPEQTILVFGVSKKDMQEDPRFSFQSKKDGKPSYLQPYVKGPQKPMTQHAYVISTDVADFPILGQTMRDASAIRAAYFKGNDNIRSKILTDLYGLKAAKILKPIFDKNLQLTENFYNKLLAFKKKLQEAKSIQHEILDENIVLSPNDLVDVYLLGNDRRGNKIQYLIKSGIPNKNVPKLLDYLHLHGFNREAIVYGPSKVSATSSINESQDYLEEK